VSDINPTPDEVFNDVFGGRQPVAGFVADAITSVAPHSLAIVADDEKLYGVVSERDIVNAVALGSDLDTTQVEAIETENLKWAAATSTVDDVAEEMLENYLRHVLVGSDDGGLLGVVSMRDLLTAYLV